jgi:hypothetical protein
MVIKYENGFPTKRTMTQLLRNFGIDDKRIQLNADFGEQRCGILWKDHKLDESMHSFLKFLEFNEILIANTKFTGQIHSIWIKQNDLYLCNCD